MIKKTYLKFYSLPHVIKQMLFLFWIYIFGQIIIALFLNAFVYLKTQSFLSLIIYNSIFYGAIILGFVVWGFATSKIHLSMRWNFLYAFVLFCGSFLLLFFFSNTYPLLLIFGLVNGTGQGVFWVALHSYEVVFTHDDNRDFYSSMVNGGAQVLGLFSPLIATISFFAAEHIFHTETFKVISIVLPIIYSFALIIIYQIPEYTPKKINLKQIKQLLFDKKIKRAKQYFIAGSFRHAMQPTIVPAIAAIALKTMVNIGILEIIISIFSIISIMSLSHIRHAGNRIKIMTYAITGLCTIYTILLFWPLSIYFFIIFQLAMVILKPMFRISEHVIDLKSIEIIKQEESDFYAGLLFRDLILGFGRLFILALFAILAFVVKNDIIVIEIGIIFLACNLIYIRWTAKKLLYSKINT